MSDPTPRERVTLGGADCFLLATAPMMRRTGQGVHTGLTVLELGPGLDTGALSRALDNFSARHPLLRSEVRKTWAFGLPTWHPAPARIPAPRLTVHPDGTAWETLCHERMNHLDGANLLVDVVPHAAGHRVIITWAHLLFDGRGAELMVQELAGNVPDATGRSQWGHPSSGTRLRDLRVKAASFLSRGDELREQPFHALASWDTQAGSMRHEVTVFSEEETHRVRERQGSLNLGWLPLPLFLAAAFRAHATVLTARGVPFRFLQSQSPVQVLKPGARFPLFQNQVNFLPFSIAAAELPTLPDAVAVVRRQFDTMTRARVDTAFGLVAHAMRRLPARWYLAFLKHQTSGPLTSFFHSHTGPFVPGLTTFHGAPLVRGWHVPSVCSPPGTGIFFNESGGRLIFVLCWRDGVLTDAERARMRASVRRDLGLDPETEGTVT